MLFHSVLRFSSSSPGNNGVVPCSGPVVLTVFPVLAATRSDCTGLGPLSSAVAGRVPCARSAVVSSSSARSFLSGTAIVMPPFFLVCRQGVRRTENDSGPWLCANLRYSLHHGHAEVRCRARHDNSPPRRDGLQKYPLLSARNSPSGIPAPASLH